MKRKKWSEVEEQTLLSKYSDLLNSGALAKLKTREKKFRPVADHVNSLHHHRDPSAFPFKWSWRDVCIKVQNMRHQYLGVKQKIRVSSTEFNWGDGEIHWENFLKYKEVFGDIELCDNGGVGGMMSRRKIGEEGIVGILGGEIDDDDDSEEMEGDDLGVSDDDGGGEGGAKGENEESGSSGGKRLENKGFGGKRLRMVGGKLLELREAIMRSEEKRGEREWSKEVREIEKEDERREREMLKNKKLGEREEGIFDKEMELQEMQMASKKREFEKRMRLEREVDEGRRRRVRFEEKWEEEETEWRERMVEMQIEHEKQMMQMHADACHNQMQILGVVARLMCQFFGSNSDGLVANSDGLGGPIPPQEVQNMQHGGGLGGDGGKADATLPSEFC